MDSEEDIKNMKEWGLLVELGLYDCIRNYMNHGLLWTINYVICDDVVQVAVFNKVDGYVDKMMDSFEECIYPTMKLFTKNIRFWVKEDKKMTKEEFVTTVMGSHTQENKLFQEEGREEFYSILWYDIKYVCYCMCRDVYEILYKGIPKKEEGVDKILNCFEDYVRFRASIYRWNVGCRFHEENVQRSRKENKTKG